MKIRTDFEIPYDREEMKNAFGVRMGKSLKRPRILKEFEYIMDILPDLVEPKLGWDSFKVRTIEEGRFLLENGKKIGEGPMIDVLKESEELIISLATIGKSIDEKIIEFQNEKKLMTAVILDTLGSWIVGRIYHQFELECKMDLNDNGLHHNISFAAGSTEWGIEDQQVIFDLLEPEKLGLKLTDVYLMVPQKSLSSLFGVSTKPFQLDHVKRCELCPRKDSCRIYTAGGI